MQYRRLESNKNDPANLYDETDPGSGRDTEDLYHTQHIRTCE